ncbi:MAG TPA: hypothetical protein VI636_17515 [Candidatus Angelobacter sp.]
MKEDTMPHKGLFQVRSHRAYEGLCAKAAYGGASDDEFDQLMEHAQSCADCRALLRDFMRIIANVVPQVAEAYSRTGLTPVNSIDGARATAAVPRIGGRLKPPRMRRRWLVLVASCAAVILCAVLLTTYVRLKGLDRERSTAAPAIPSHNNTGTDNAREREISTAIAGLKGQLQVAEHRIGEFQSELRNTREATSAAESDKAQLLARIESYEKTIAENQRIAQEQASAVENLEQQIADKETILKSRDVALATLAGRVTETTEQLNHQREINAALSKAQELIAARDLHLISVPPMEPHTEGSRPFGRILYAEGKELMFYGYDLAGSSELANATFHVWGEKIGSGGPVSNLGVFKNDDKADSRWRLTFGDANVLAKIDRIFVTIEPGSEAVTKPGGKKILIAYLGDKPNHP